MWSIRVWHQAIYRRYSCIMYSVLRTPYIAEIWFHRQAGVLCVVGVKCIVLPRNIHCQGRKTRFMTRKGNWSADKSGDISVLSWHCLKCISKGALRSAKFSRAIEHVSGFTGSSTGLNLNNLIWILSLELKFEFGSSKNGSKMFPQCEFKHCFLAEETNCTSERDRDPALLLSCWDETRWEAEKATEHSQSLPPFSQTPSN